MDADHGDNDHTVTLSAPSVATQAAHPRQTHVRRAEEVYPQRSSWFLSVDVQRKRHVR